MGYYDNDNFGEKLLAMAVVTALVALAFGARALWHWIFS